jgi:uncharacterized protein (TIGR02231 family)
MAAARPSGPIRYRVAEIEVTAERAGSLTMELTYVAPGAMWRPSYRAVLDAATGEINLGVEAVVTQSTGEDWVGVSLRLSTASPSQGVEPPELASLLLRPVEVMALRSKATGARETGLRIADGDGSPRSGSFGDNLNLDSIEESEVLTAGAAAEPGAAQGGFASIRSPSEAEQRGAGISTSAYNVSFEVPGTSDVPADGRDHRVGLSHESLAGDVSYRAVPALNEAAFLIVKTKAPAGYPLLSGGVRVFAGGAFLGSFPIAETGPGEEVTLPFGVDNRIRVERTPLPQSREQKGIVGKDRVITYAFRSTVTNLRDQAVRVTLEDRIPVSEDERVEVELGRDTTLGHREVEDRPGILEWDLDLAAGEKRELLLTWSVRFPKELVVPGI